MPSPIIQVTGLTRSIDTGTHRVDILRGIDFDVPAGQFVAIMGASGSGKSTLLGLLAGLDSPTTGSIVLDGVDITKLEEDAMAKVRGMKLGFVFQSYQLIPTLTAEENVLLPAELTGKDTGGIARARELLIRVGLRDRLDHYPVQLSGGEQQRVALARAFINAPKILFCDEPTGNLDADTAQAMTGLIFEMNRERGATLVLVTHDIELARRCGRILRLRAGSVVEDFQTRAFETGAVCT